MTRLMRRGKKLNSQLISLRILLSLTFLVTVPVKVSSIKCFKCKVENEQSLVGCLEKDIGEMTSCTSDYCQVYWADAADAEDGEFSCAVSNDVGKCVEEAGELHTEQLDIYKLMYSFVDVNPEGKYYNSTRVEVFKSCLDGKGVSTKILERYQTEKGLIIVCNNKDYCNSWKDNGGPTIGASTVEPEPQDGILCYECEGKPCEKISAKTPKIRCPSGYCKFHHDSDADEDPGPSSTTSRGCGKHTEGVCAKEHGDSSQCLNKNTREQFFQCASKASEPTGFGKLINDRARAKYGKQQQRDSEDKVVGKWCICHTELCNNIPVPGSGMSLHKRIPSGFWRFASAGVAVLLQFI